MRVTRRDFLIATSAVGDGLLLGFGLPARSLVRDAPTTDAPFAPNAFLRIDRAGNVATNAIVAATGTRVRKLPVRDQAKSVA